MTDKQDQKVFQIELQYSEFKKIRIKLFPDIYGIYFYFIVLFNYCIKQLNLEHL